MELVIVVLILGIMSSVAVPAYLRALSRARVDAAARRIAADLEMAQREAEVASSSRTFSFLPLENRYAIAGAADMDRPLDAHVVCLCDSPYVSTIETVDLGGDESLVFDGFGKPDSGGTIVIRSGPLQRTVVVDAATGKGAIQ